MPKIAMTKVKATVDTMLNGIQSVDFDKEMRDFSGGLFRMLDQDDDGCRCKFSPADAAMYTDLFFVPCPDHESAKKKFMAIFNKLDLAKSGTLSQDEISCFIAKIVHLCAPAALPILSVAEVQMDEQMDHDDLTRSRQ